MLSTAAKYQFFLLALRTAHKISWLSSSAAIGVAFRGDRTCFNLTTKLNTIYHCGKAQYEALGQLENSAIAARSLRRYRTIWQHLICFFTAEGFRWYVLGEFGRAFYRGLPHQGRRDRWSKRWMAASRRFRHQITCKFCQSRPSNRTRTDMQKVHRRVNCTAYS